MTSRREANLQALLDRKNKVKRKRSRAPPRAPESLPTNPEDEAAESVSALQETIRKKRSEILQSRKRAVVAETELHSAKTHRELLDQELDKLRQQLSSHSSHEVPDASHEVSHQLTQLRADIQTARTENSQLKEQLDGIWQSFREFQEQIQRDRLALEANKLSVLNQQQRVQVPSREDAKLQLLRKKERLMADIANARQHLDNLVLIAQEKQETIELQEHNRRNLIIEKELLEEALNCPSLPADPPPEFAPIIEVQASARNLVSDLGSTGSMYAAIQEEAKASQPDPEENLSSHLVHNEPQFSPREFDQLFDSSVPSEQMQEATTPRRELELARPVTPPRFALYEPAGPPVHGNFFEESLGDFGAVPDNLFD